MKDNVALIDHINQQQQLVLKYESPRRALLNLDLIAEHAYRTGLLVNDSREH